MSHQKTLADETNQRIVSGFRHVFDQGGCTGRGTAVPPLRRPSNSTAPIYYSPWSFIAGL